MDKEYPLVSIGIITYNQKEYLRECIESCLAQDYPNFEIVVADDCSTDGTQDLLREYNLKYQDKFVLCLAENNQGITHNSNACLDACKGDFIALTGGDDVLLANKITEQVEIFKNNKDVVVCGSYTKLINENGNIIGERFDYKNKSLPFYNQSELIESNTTLVPVVSYMIRADAKPEEGFDFRLPVASDSLFYIRVAEKGRIFVVKKFLMAYRIHQSHAKKLGYRDDTFVSRALAEYYYPNCFFSHQRSKAKMYYSMGRHKANESKFKDAKKLFIYSLNYHISMKTLFALIMIVLRK